MRFDFRHLARATLLVAASLSLAAPSARGQQCLDATVACASYRPYTEASQPDVFFNLYQPNNFGAAAAAYPAPYPTPNLVGHTYYTYQPLMPHEFLYQHRRTYHQYYNGGKGLNRTTVRWHGTPIRTSLKSVHKWISLPR